MLLRDAEDSPGTADGRRMRVPATARAAVPLLLLLCVLFAAWFCLPLVYGPVDTGAGHAAPRFHNLIFDSHEKLHYVIRLSEFDDALAHGQWVVRWCRNLDGGYGYPFFNFYAPLAYYLADAWHAAGLDLFLAWKMHFLAMAVAGCVGVYLLARLWCGQFAAGLGALVWLLAPYHIANLYVRGNVAEYTAMSICPFVVLAFLRLSLGSAGPRQAALAGGALAALVACHNITALFGAAMLCLCMVALWAARGRAFPLLAVAGAAALGVAVSAFFWLPAMYEIGYCQAGGLAGTFGETPQHTVGWRQYFAGTWGFGLSAPGHADGMSFVLGWSAWGGAFVALAMLAWRRSADRARRAATAAFSVALAVLLLAMSDWCAWLWTLPGFSTIQFPWRLLLFAVMFAAVLAALGVEMLLAARRGAGVACAVALALLAACDAAPKLRAQSYYPTPPAVYSPAATRQRWITTNIGEFRPKWVETMSGDFGSGEVSHGRVLDDGGATIARAGADALTDLRFTHETSTPMRLRYEAHYFPGWAADCGGSGIPVMASRPRGLVEFTAPAGRHDYRVRLGRSPVRTLADSVSLAGVGVVLLLVAVSLRRRGDNSVTEAS